jgi:hypothetical protein
MANYIRKELWCQLPFSEELTSGIYQNLQANQINLVKT